MTGGISINIPLNINLPHYINPIKHIFPRGSSILALQAGWPDLRWRGRLDPSQATSSWTPTPLRAWSRYQIFPIRTSSTLKESCQLGTLKIPLCLLGSSLSSRTTPSAEKPEPILVDLEGVDPHWRVSLSILKLIPATCLHPYVLVCVHYVSVVCSASKLVFWYLATNYPRVN